MKKILFFLLQVSLCTAGYLCTSNNIAQAQVTSDGTVDTQVNQNGNVAEITGGTKRGSNLFHSFQDFSVPTGNEAFFNNALNISNIFSRVTGGNISNIDGAIRANGSSASLFLINPNGIIFGENARLNIGGSFLASTSSSILFEDGEFSAVNDLQQPLLTINAPIGLGFRDNPGNVITRASVGDGLEVLEGQRISLIGGNVNIENRGIISAPEGRIELGGLLETGTINLNEDNSLSFPDGVNRGNISLTDSSIVRVAGSQNGFIEINAANLELSDNSQISGGIAANLNLPDAQAGNIVINLTEDLNLNNSKIDNQVDNLAEGNAGNIDITTGSLSLTNGGLISAETFGRGNGGSININASDTISVDGQSSAIASTVNAGAVGMSGDLTIVTGHLDIINGGIISTSIFGLGNGGSIKINATDTINLATQSRVTSDVDAQAEGNSGDLQINTGSLSLKENALVSAQTFGQGNAGSIDITADDTIIVDGQSSAIASTVNPDAVGMGGDLTIATGHLDIINGGIISTTTFGQGNAGSIEISADDTVNLGTDSRLTSQVNNIAEGSAGNVEITTDLLSLTDGALISAETFGLGNGGSIDITASDTIVIDGQFSAIDDRFTAISSTVNPDAVGMGGDLTIATGHLDIINGGIISTTTFGQGNAGSIEISATDTVNLEAESQITSEVNLSADGNAGTVKVVANSLSLNNNASINASINASNPFRFGGVVNLQIAEDIILASNGSISARAIGEANGGNLDIDARFIIAFPQGNNDIIANAQQGRGGNISINAESLFGIQKGTLSDATNDINASSNVSGLEGNVNITTPDINPVQGATELPNNIVVPEETTQQACEVNRELEAKNGLSITGRGGVQAEPGLPLNSLNVTINGQNPTSAIPKPIKTSQGKIQPARGVRVTESGKVILTAYRTNNAGDKPIFKNTLSANGIAPQRLLGIKRNCGQS